MNQKFQMQDNSDLETVKSEYWLRKACIILEQKCYENISGQTFIDYLINSLTDPESKQYISSSFDISEGNDPHSSVYYKNLKPNGNYSLSNGVYKTDFFIAKNAGSIHNKIYKMGFVLDKNVSSEINSTDDISIIIKQLQNYKTTC